MCVKRGQRSARYAVLIAEKLLIKNANANSIGNQKKTELSKIALDDVSPKLTAKGTVPVNSGGYSGTRRIFSLLKTKRPLNSFFFF